MARILITGGGGFVGVHLANWFIKAGHQVFVIDDCSKWGELSFKYLEGCTLIQGSILDDRVYGWFPRPSMVYHLAVVDINSAEREPLRSLQVNVAGALKVAQYAQRMRVDNLVYVSSASIYGNGPVPSLESNTPDVGCLYAAQKLIGENICLSSRIPVTVFRLTNTYGPDIHGHKLRERGSIGNLIHAIYGGEFFALYGDGSQTRDYVYIDDVVEALLRAQGNGIYNVGTGIETATSDLVELIGQMTNRELEIHPTPPRKVDYIQRRALDISRIERDLGWKPEVSLETGLARCISSMEE